MRKVDLDLVVVGGVLQGLRRRRLRWRRGWPPCSSRRERSPGRSLVPGMSSKRPVDSWRITTGTFRPRFDPHPITSGRSVSTCTRKRIDPGFLEGVPCITARHEYHHCDTDLEPGVFNVFMNAEYGVYPAGKGMVAARDDHRAGEACLQRGTPQPSRSRYPAIDQGHDGVAARRRCGPRHAKGRHRGPAQKAPSPELRLPILTPIAGAGCSDRTIVSDFWVGFGQGRWCDG